MAFPIGETAALLTSLLWALSSTLFTLGTQKRSPQAVNRIRITLALILLSATVTVIYKNPLPPGGRRVWFYLGLSGVVGLTIGDSLLFYSYRIIGPRTSMLLMSLVPVVTTAAAWIFMNENIAPLKLLAIGVTLFGITAVVMEKGDDKGPFRRSWIGVALGVGAMLGQAGGLLLAKVILNEGYPPLPATYIRVMWGAASLWALGFLTGGWKEVPQAVKDLPCLKVTAVATVLGPYLGIWLSLVAVSYSKLGIASTLMSLSPIFLIPISVKVFHEKVGLRAILGTLVATAGVAAILLL